MLFRFLIPHIAALALLFLLNAFDFRAGGALAALVLGLLLNVLWARCVRLPYLLPP